MKREVPHLPDVTRCVASAQAPPPSQGSKAKPNVPIHNQPHAIRQRDEGHASTSSGGESYSRLSVSRVDSGRADSNGQ